MSLKEIALTLPSAKDSIFKELIAKNKDLDTYTYPGIPRTISADDLADFKAPDENWLSKTRPQRARTGGQTESTYTVEFDATSGSTDKENLKKALNKGQKGGPSATSSISLFVVWEQAVPNTNAPAPWKCALIKF
jgi:hypothetical protein